jgi:membrane protease YdiL (CAAX protease family)
MKLRAIWQENSPYSKLLITVGAVLVFMTLFTVLGTIIASVLYGIPYDQLANKMGDMQDPVGLSIMKIIQTASSFGVFIFPALFLAFTFSDSWQDFLQVNRSGQYKTYLWVVLLMLVAIPGINILAEWNNTVRLPAALGEIEKMFRNLEDRAAQVTEAFMKMQGAGDLAVNLVVIAILPALGEELFFRGLLQRVFSDWSRNIHVGIWLSAFVFSALHGQFYGFIPRMLLGGMFGYLLAWSGSLWIPVIAHLMNNAAAVTATYLYQKGMLGFNPDETGTTPTETLLGIVSILLTLSMVYYFRKMTVKNVVSKNA